MEPVTIQINDVEYVRKDSLSEEAEKFDGLECVIVRTYSAGVFYGYLASESEDGKKVVLKKARRMWKWYGASLSQCAQSGTSDKNQCKFPEPVDSIKLTEAIEILSLTSKAKKSLDGVSIWKA